jgi:hypothetical protein
MPDDGSVPDGWEEKETSSGMWIIPKSIQERGNGVQISKEGLTIGRGTVIAILGAFLGAGGVEAFSEFRDASDEHAHLVTEHELSEWKHELDLVHFQMQDDIDDMQDDMKVLVEDIKVILSTLNEVRYPRGNPRGSPP